MAGRYALDGIITVVDAVHATGQLAANKVAAAQIGFADRILITKTDVAQPGDVISAQISAPWPISGVLVIARKGVREHLPPEAQAFFGRDRAWCATQAERIGASCAALIEQLLSDHVLERLRAAQGVLALLKPYGAARLEAACARALAHG